MSKTKEYNPFSDVLMNLINGVYSENNEFASRSFKLLIDYFKMGCATDREIDFLILDNNNYIVKLLNDLISQPEAHELLRSTVGKVVADALSQEETADRLSITDDEELADISISGEIFYFDEEL